MWRPSPLVQLSGQCAQQVLGEEVEEAKDWRVNPQLHKACAADAGALLGGGGWGVVHSNAAP